MNIAILEDNADDAETLKRFIERFYGEGFCAPDCYSEEEDFLSGLHGHGYDLVFLDIVLGDRDGIRVGERVNTLSPSTDIVFISSHPDYFQDVYRARHSWFLTKPLDWDRFEDAMKRISLRMEQSWVRIRTKRGTERIAASDILYLESSLKHTVFHMADGTAAEYSALMREIEKQLSDVMFVRIHKSYIVNVRTIARYNSRCVELENGQRLAISRTYYRTARERLTRILAEN